MFRTTIPLGRIAGIPIRAHWSVVIVLAILSWILGSSVLPRTVPGYPTGLYWLAALTTAVCFLGSLLAHEMTHAVIARRYGLPVNRITLWALGGMAELEGEPPSPKADLLVAAGGPAMSLLIGGVSLGVAYLLNGAIPGLLVVAIAWLGATNLLLGVFNLLPGTPLDGGRVLRSAVWRGTGDRTKAVLVAARAGQGLGVVMILAGVAEMIFWRSLTGGIWLAVVGWFLISSARAELAGDRTRRAIGDMRLRAAMDTQPVTAPAWWTIDTFMERVEPHTRRRVFPVLSFENELVGVVSLAELTGFTSTERGHLRIADVCRAAPPRVDADERVVSVLSRTRLRPGLDLLVITDRGRLAGVADTDDLDRSLQLAMARPGTRS